MSQKPVPGFQVITSGDMSGNITSAACDIENLVFAYFQMKWTGTPVGTFSVQVSGDHKETSQGAITVPGTWTTLTINPTPTASGSAADWYIDLNEISVPWVRLVYTFGSSTGSLNVTFGAKGS